MPHFESSVVEQGTLVFLSCSRSQRSSLSNRVPLHSTTFIRKTSTVSMVRLTLDRLLSQELSKAILLTPMSYNDSHDLVSKAVFKASPFSIALCSGLEKAPMLLSLVLTEVVSFASPSPPALSCGLVVLTSFSGFSFSCAITALAFPLSFFPPILLGVKKSSTSFLRLSTLVLFVTTPDPAFVSFCSISDLK